MPLKMKHVRDGKPVLHNWSPALGAAMYQAAEMEGKGNEILSSTGSYTFKEDHDYEQMGYVSILNEEPIRAGDVVEAWR